MLWKKLNKYLKRLSQAIELYVTGGHLLALH